MVKCPECGKEVEDNNFCGNCGTEIIKENVCSNCGKQLDDGHVFCPNCGKKIKDDSQEEEISDEEETTPTDESEEETSQEDTENDESEEDEESEEETTPTDESEEDEESEEETEDEEEENISDTDKKLCPYCNCEIEDDDVVFCPECGKSIEIDKQSMKGIRNTIEFKKLTVFTLISIGLSFLLSLALSYIIGMLNFGDLYPVGFIISLVLIIGIFGSFKEIINGGLLGLITGLVIGILSTYIVELSCGFKFSYMMLYGYGSIIFTVLGLIIGMISSQLLRNSVKKLIDVEKIF